jgi:hypothetical protein
MGNYRAYILGDDDHIIERVDLVACEDDAAPTLHAKLLVIGHTVELWDGDRLIASFEPRH